MINLEEKLKSPSRPGSRFLPRINAPNNKVPSSKSYATPTRKRQGAIHARFQMGLHEITDTPRRTWTQEKLEHVEVGNENA